MKTMRRTLVNLHLFLWENHVPLPCFVECFIEEKNEKYYWSFDFACFGRMFGGVPEAYERL
jgi:hypothetical protein